MLLSAVTDLLNMTGFPNSVFFVLGLMSESVLEPLPVTEQSLYFPCGDGEMISVLGKCDGKRDCISGLDEEGCNTSGNVW